MVLLHLVRNKREDTSFDFISQATTNAIMDLAIKSKKPIGNGVITCLNLKQAKIRRKKVPRHREP